MNKHKWTEAPTVGQRVIMCYTDEPRWINQEAIITVCLPSQSDWSCSFLRVEAKDGRSRSTLAYRFRPAGPVKPIVHASLTRGGHRVISAEARGEFIMGVIDVKGTVLALRYAPSGYFMPGKSNPVDLVEAK